MPALLETTLLLPDVASTQEPEELELVPLRELVVHLRRENRTLKQQANYWQSRHADAKERLAKLQAEIERLQADKRQLQDQVFGPKSEKQTRTDRSHTLVDPHDTQPKRSRGQQSDRPGPSRRDYSHLPVRLDIQVLPEAEQRCPDCGRPWTTCGSEDSEQIEIETVCYRRVIRRQRYQKTCQCPGPRTRTAPTVPKLIPKSRFGVSVWVDLLLDKFASQRPTQRLVAQWRLLGLDVALGTVTEGLRLLEPLFQPLYEALQQRNRQSRLLAADETRWLVFVEAKDKENYQWWLWVFGGADTVIYLLDPSRSHTVPEAHLPDESEGVILLVDRWCAYKATAQVKAGQVLLAFCWAHVRRDFVRVGKGFPELKEWALAWLRRIRDLYALNRQRLSGANGVAAQAQLEHAVTQLRGQLDKELADPTLRLACRAALTSLQEHWDGLIRFVTDARIPMDNNVSERRLRNPVVGRKNYYGSGAVWSGRLAAMLFSLFATLSLWQINARLWLRWYLQSCAAAGGQPPTSVEPFLPWNLSKEKLRELGQADAAASPDSS